MKVLSQSITQKKHRNNLFIVNSVWNCISNELCVDPQLVLRKRITPDGELFISTLLRKNYWKAKNPRYSKGKFLCYLIGIYTCKRGNKHFMQQEETTFYIKKLSLTFFLQVKYIWYFSSAWSESVKHSQATSCYSRLWMRKSRPWILFRVINAFNVFLVSS